MMANYDVMPTAIFLVACARETIATGIYLCYLAGP